MNRQIEGGGVTEAQWAASSWLQTLPRASATALFGDAQRLVVVSPHPDDEVLACGGLMALAHQSGLRVMVVSVTDGEACYPDQPAWSPERLRTARAAELDDALHCLGLSGAERISWHIGDGEVTANEAWIAAQLAAVLQRDDLVLAPWRFDGHPDHEAVARACLQACSERGADLKEYPVWGWHWLDPQAAPTAWASAARVALDDALLDRKRDAIQQFVTQTGAVAGLDCDPILPAAVLQRFERNYEVLIG
ncbi:PIG-L family deacetylase [Stenotrophomonas sp. HMSC10F06]|uniref:PIG-L deacetylase family protein n=1 Tax=Stenotrophomonas sp. HMSC10F06 TaxID=1581081 RepID=UPI0009F6877B|nr:PIG-L family deacetylase [Stenotrophomonas sp. HMSC10F06]